MKFKSLSALLALSAASLSYAGGMLDAPKEVGAKSPVMTLGYRSLNINLNDSATEIGLEDPEAQTGYVVGLTVPLVGPWSTGVHYTGFSRMDTQETHDSDDTEVIGTIDGALTSFAYHVGYDVPFSVMDNLSLTGKLIAENTAVQIAATPKDEVTKDDARSIYSVGFGLSGQYFMDAFGLEVGIDYLNPQGVRTLASSTFSWRVSLAYKLA